MNPEKSSPTCWKIGTTKGGSGPDRWPSMHNGRYIAIGWSGVGDLSGYPDGEAGRIPIRSRIQEINRGLSVRQAGRAAGEILRFREIDREHLVVACAGAKVLAIGIVNGIYEYAPVSDFPHHYPVEWLSKDNWKLPVNEGPRFAVRQLENPANLSEVHRRIR